MPVFYGLPDSVLAEAVRLFQTEEFPADHLVLRHRDAAILRILGADRDQVLLQRGPVRHVHAEVAVTLDAQRRVRQKVAVADDDQEPVVVDWRAPVAEPFYRATGREPMGLRRRRHFVTRGRELLGVETLALVERCARSEIESLESGRMLHRCDFASPHHPGTGINWQPFRPRQVDALGRPAERRRAGRWRERRDRSTG